MSSSRRLLQSVLQQSTRRLSTRALGVVARRRASIRLTAAEPRAQFSPFPTTYRSFASGNKRGGGGDSKNTFSIRVVYSSFEMEERAEPEEILKFKTVNSSGKKITLSNVQRTIGESYGLEPKEARDLEFYANGTWKKLTDPSQQLAGKQAVPVRAPGSFTDEDDEEGYGDDDYGGGGPLSEEDEDYMRNSGFDSSMYESDRDFLDDELMGGKIGHTIKDLVASLKLDKYVCSPNSLQLKNPKGEVISTKDFVLEAADDDPELQRLLVNKVGAMDHIVNAIHYPFLWKEQAEGESSDNRSKQIDSA